MSRLCSMAHFHKNSPFGWSFEVQQFFLDRIFIINLSLMVPLEIVELWSQDLYEANGELDFDIIWKNVFVSSKKFAHQLIIHFFFLQRFYITPQFQMKCIAEKLCSKCVPNKIFLYPQYYSYSSFNLNPLHKKILLTCLNLKKT